MPQQTNPQREESAERLARPLIRLANMWGISTSYIDQLGTYVEIEDDVLVTVLKALGVDASSVERIQDALDARIEADATLLAPPTVVKFIGTDKAVELHTLNGEPQVTLTLEDGTMSGDNTFTVERKGAEAAPDAGIDVYELTLTDALPIGYHTLNVTDGERSATAHIICAPARIPVPQAVQDRHRWGWMAQMYSVRSADSWGVGDYGDLKELAVDAARKSHADFMLINPIHATAPITPLEPSPYLPESRRFLNVTYIRPQDIPEYKHLEDDDFNKVEALHAGVAAANTDPNPIDINAAWDAKREALKIVFRQERSADRQAAFDEFRQKAGEDLRAFALWSVAFQVWGAPWDSENDWFATYDRHSPEIAHLEEEYGDLFEFECWLQWIASEQIEDAQKAAKDAGMALGLMQDMAVGVHTYGSDVWWSPERFAVGTVTVGCPPDFYNQQGQDWGQPPFDPNFMESDGYNIYRYMVHNMFEHAGAIRIDHVLGMFRLWWIPQGKGPRGGAYVRYNYEAMLAILTVEASRVDGMVIGEDLGTVPDYVSRILAAHGVLGTTVEWFARVDDSPNAGDPYAMPDTYREYSLASVTTHDLPPTAGYLMYEHVKLREKLHLLSEPVEEFMKSAEAEQHAMLRLLVSGGWLPQAAADDVPGHLQQIVEAMHAMLKDSPALLMQASLVDGVGEMRTQNQPGTSTEYPNWRIPLADAEGHVIPTDKVFDSPRVMSLAAIMNR